MMKSAQEIEQHLLTILRDNRPGVRVRGCNNHLEAYDKAIQEVILSPLLAEAGKLGLAEPLDDHGHRMPFVSAWNRAVVGKSKSWDCRCLASVFVQAAVKDVPDLFKKIFSEDFDDIDNALLKNLPDILSGAGMQPNTRSSLQSWVNSEHIYVQLDGYKAILTYEDGTALREHDPLIAFMDADTGEDPFQLIGLMSFHSDDVDYDQSQAAWSAWQRAMDKESLLHRNTYDSMMHLMSQSLYSFEKVGLGIVHLRQDESLSVDVGPEGCTVYLGEIDDLRRIYDEGQFIFGARSTFEKILIEGGFTEMDATQYIEKITSGSAAFLADIPEHSKMRFMIDPETLNGFDMPDDDMVADISRDEAIPILAAGTFDMPKMETWRARSARTKEEAQEPGL